MTYYEIIAYFLVYSFLGWALEVAYHAVSVGKVINRGFLNGPICPIYGFGMLSVLLILGEYTDHLAALTAGGILFATAIELFGGWALNRIFHMRWWDYSKEPFNLGGYICLRFSLAWGICIVLAVRVIHPIIALNARLLNNPVGWVILGVCCTALAVDLTATVMTVLHLNRDLKKINSAAQDIRKFSDGLTEQIADKTLEANRALQERKAAAAVKEEALQQKLAQTAERMSDRFPDRMPFGYRRLAAAFPGLKHDQYNEELRRLRETISARRALVRQAAAREAAEDTEQVSLP